MSQSNSPQLNIHPEVTPEEISQTITLKYAGQLEIIQEISHHIGSEKKLEDSVQRVLNRLVADLGYTGAQLYRLSPSGRDVWLFMEAGSRSQGVKAEPVIFSIEDDNLISRALRQGDLIYGVGPADESEDEPIGTVSEVAISLGSGAEPVGVLLVQAEHEFDPVDISFLRSLGGLLATAMATSQSLRELRDELREIQILYRLQRGDERERQPISGRMSESGYEYDRQTIRQIEAAPDEARLVVSRNQAEVSAIQKDDGRALVAPIRLYNETIGTLGVEDAAGRREWSAEEIELLEQVSTQVALAIENSRLLQQAQERTKELSLLFEISQQLSETVDLRQIYEILAREVLKYLKADSGQVWLLDATGRRVEPVVLKARARDGQVIELKDSGLGPVTVREETWLQGWLDKPELVIGPVGEEWQIGTTGRSEPGTMAIFPVVVRSNVMGLLQMIHYQPQRDYTSEEVQLAQAIIARATVAIENAQLFQQSEDALAETRQLYQISRSLVESATLADIFEVVLSHVKLFEIDRVSISLLDRDHQGEIDGVTIVASWDRESTDLLPVGTKLGADTFSLVQTFAKPPFHPLICEDLRQTEGQDERMDDGFRLFMYQGLGALTLFSAPMFLGPEYKGVLSISTRQPHQYTEQEVRIYQTLADQAIIAIERQRLLAATQRERDRASLLYELGQILSRTTNIEAVKETVLDFKTSLNVAHGEIYITDGDEFVSMASTLPARWTPASLDKIRADLIQGPEAEALSRNATVQQNWDTGELAGLAAVTVPFYSQRSSLQGVLTFYRQQQAGFSQDDISTLESVTRQTSASLENVWLLEQMAAALKETELLYKATRDFNSARHVEELLVILVESFRETDIDYMAIGRAPGLDDEERLTALEISASWDRNLDAVSHTAFIARVAEYPFLRALRPTTPYQIRLEELAEPVQAQVAQLVGPGRSVLCVPLHVGRNWLGILLVASRVSEAIFRLNAINQIFALAGQAAVVMQNLELVKETQQNLYNSEILSHLSQELLVAETNEAIYNICLEAIAATEPGRGAAIFMYEQIEGSVDLEMMALWNNPDQDWPEVPVGARFSTEELGLSPLLKTGETVVSTNAVEDERFSDTLRQLLIIMQINSLVAIPVWLNKEVNGFILIGHQEYRAFSNEIVRLYEDISRQVSGALENRRLFEEAQYRARLLETAAVVSQAATGTLDLANLLPQTVDLIQDHFGYYHVSIFLVDDYRKYAVIEASTGEIGQQMLEMKHKLEVGGKSIVGAATASGKPRIALDVGTDAFHFNNPLLPETRSEMALPLIAQGRVIGALDVQSRQQGAFSQSDITILQSMANQLANVIEAARAYQESRQVLEEVRKLHEHYVREQWGTFLKEKGASADYRLTEAGIVSVLADRQADGQDWQPDLSRAIEARQPVLLSPPEEAAESSILAAPLILHDTVVIGTVELGVDRQQQVLDEDTLQIVEAVTSQAAQALEAARLFEQTQVAREEAEALYRVGRALVASESAREMYHTVLREMLSTLGLKQGGILFFDEERQYGILHALFENSRPVAPGLRFPIKGNLSYDQLIQTKQPVAIEDVATDPLVATVRDINLSRGIASLLLVPIIINDEVLGAIGADALGRKHVFTEREINLARAMADQLSLMLQNRRLLEETRRRAVQLQTSADVGRVATSILDQDLMLSEAVELIKERFGFYHVQIFLIDEAGQFAVLYKSTGEAGQKLLALNHKVAIGSQSVIGQVTDQRQPTVVRDTASEDARPAANQRNEFLPDTRAELAIPLQVGETLVGVLDVQSTFADAFTSEDISTLETLAAQLAIAIQNARAFHEQQATAERLKEIDKLKTQFLANMSHELRTPLNSIIGFSRVILKGIDGPLTDLQKTDLTSIHNSGQHLLGLINNILDLSKIEAGKMELNFEEVEIEPIIKGVMSTAIALVKDKEVNLVQEVPESLPTIWADATRIRQVILNLASNACKFTDTGTVMVKVWADVERMIISVADTGIGIPENQLESIFEEFTQVDASTTRKVGGSGLGLPISRHFVEMHKGNIWVESVPGKGSVFYISLPLRPVEEEAEAEADKEAPDTTDGQTRLILAIDDDPGVITLYKRFLEKQGYTVVGLNDSKNVVEKTKECRPAAILLDVLIPEKDGWGVIRELKNDPHTRDIPVIICSIVSDKNRGFSLGAADYLIKPIVEDELVTALKKLDNGRNGRIKVLVVDDQEDDILLIRRILEAQPNYDIIEARSGQEGLDRVQRDEPDLIILDLTMPGIDGFSVVEALKGNEKARSIPILIVTAKELTSSERHLLNGQVEVLLRKGIFTENELLEDVSRALKQIRKKEAEII